MIISPNVNRQSSCTKGFFFQKEKENSNTAFIFQKWRRYSDGHSKWGRWIILRTTKNTRNTHVKTPSILAIEEKHVGGFNPFEKIFVKLEIFPKVRGEHKKYLSCHHLENMLWYPSTVHCWSSIKSKKHSKFELVVSCHPSQQWNWTLETFILFKSVVNSSHQHSGLKMKKR